MKLGKKWICFFLAFVMAFTSMIVIRPQEAQAEQKKLIALTFDDGSSMYTEELLDILKANGAKATFFMIGSVGSYGAGPHMDLLDRMVQEGHQLANHTSHHIIPLSGESAYTIQREVAEVEEYLYQAMGGRYQEFVRIPGGDDSDRIRQNVDAPIMYWSIDVRDWQVDDAYYVCNSLLEQAFDGCITCMHDSHYSTVQAMRMAIPRLQAMGFECVTLSELFRRKGVTPENGSWYRIVDSATVKEPYKAPQADLQMSYVDKAIVTLSGMEEGVEYYYTTDGSYPRLNSEKMTGAMSLPYGTKIRVVGYDRFGTRTPDATISIGSEHAGVFNAKYYADKYPDLKAAFGYNEEALWNHFIKYGLSEGRIASPVFSIRYYKNKYPDLQQAFGSDYEKYVEHFLKYGMKEGRIASEEFNVRTFKASRPDLVDHYGSELPYYYFHYELYGDQEVSEVKITVYNGTDYSPVYDFNYYTENNPEVVEECGYDEVAALKHFVEKGMKEGLQASENFDVLSYKYRYTDLRQAFGSDLPAYYMHYLRYGMKEGRKATGTTSIVNPITVWEGIDYSPIYDFEYYTSHNPDVVNVLGYDDTAALKHFVEYGMKEGRQGNEYFNVRSYRKKYPDVVSVFGSDLKACYMHYLNYGIAEGRTP